MNSRKKNNFLDTVVAFVDKYPREYYVFLFFFLFFIAIVGKTFAYTVLDHWFYKTLADKQQIGQVEIPVTRWTVYASTFSPEWNNPTVFSSSVYLSDLAIDPQIEWDREELWRFLTDLLYEEMCDFETQTSCYNALLRFLRVLEIPDFEYTEDFIKEVIAQRVISRISQNKVTSVLLGRDISIEQETEIKSWNMAGLYPSEAGFYVNPEEITDPEAFAQRYVSLFWWNQEDIVFAVRKRDLRYVPIYNKLSLVVSDKLRQYLEDENRAISQGVLPKEESIGGFIILTPEAQRTYPEKQIWSQIIWFLDSEGKGHYGIEWFFDDILKWNPWELARRKDSLWRSIEFDTFSDSQREALEGVDIYTTIDRNIQRKVEEILKNWVEKYGANKWTVVVMEPDTWKIISMANYPTYDPNNPWEVYELKKINYVEYPNPKIDLLWRTVFVEDLERWSKYIYDGNTIYLREAEREEYDDYSKTKYMYKNSFGAGVYQNDAISSLYEPGSIMKSITVAVGIDTGEIKPYDFYTDDGKLTIDNFTISNVDKNCLWYNTFQNALNYSCNIGMIRIVQKLGKALLHKYLYDFGFWELTNISLEW